MATRLIQFSNNARSPNGAGHMQTEAGQPVFSTRGYIDQAHRICGHTDAFTDEQCGKAINILKAARLPELAQGVVRDLELRIEVEKKET